MIINITSISKICLQEFRAFQL